MFHKVTRAFAITLCAWLLACEAGALTVGRAGGAVLVGRPLELTIPVTLDAAETAGPCAGADVFYGETRVRREPRVQWEPGADGRGVVRLISPVPVDEPMITVYLRVGCDGRSVTRRIVMLAEMPPEAQPSASQVPLAPSTAPAAVPRASPPAMTAAPAPAPASGQPAARPPTAAPASRARPAAAPAQRPQARARAPAAETRSTRPRLRLEPLDLSVERDPVLKLSTELRTEVGSDPQQRQAAAALWAALQKGPDEILQDALRLQAVEREIGALRQAQQQDAASLAQLRARTQQAGSQRGLPGLLVGVLVAALLVLLALLGWLAWRWHARMRVERVGRWFEQHGDSGRTPLAPAHAASRRPAAVAAAVVPPAAAATATAAAGHGAAASAPPGDEFLPSRGASMRMVGVDELIDVHDKADFFLSIGEYEQAVAVLEGHVHDQVETSALAWLDLLELYHFLGRRPEYERLRGEFRQRFAVQVPEFDRFDQPMPSLENYHRALGRIVALWPAPRVLDVIEESIFRKPAAGGAEPFSLEAYRELVLLYHVATDLSQQDGAGTAPASLHDTLLEPLNMAQRPAAATPTDHDRLLIPPASARLGVDIDIGLLEPEPEPDTRPPPGPSALDFDLDDATADPGQRRG